MLRNQNAGCTIDRLGLLGAALLTLSACAATVPVESSVPVLGAATVPELSRLMEAGRLSSEALVAHCLDRIERLDPELRALIAINPEALPTARALDAERAGGRIRGPLHGIPVVLKDNIESADPLATTAGSLALKDNATGRESAPGRRGDSGQGQPERVGQFPLLALVQRLERDRRPDPQPV